MEATLYNLTDKMRALLDYIQDAENPQELEELLKDSKEALDLSIDEKLEGMMMIRQNKLARANALKEEAKRLNDLAKQEEAEVDRIESYAAYELEKLGYDHKAKERYRSVGKFNLGFKKLPPSVEILDASKIPTQYMNIPVAPPPSPDKKEIAKLLKTKAETLYGSKWTKEKDEIVIEEFGVKLVNNKQKFEIK
ncbi:host-nuclease inhibitor protein [Bacillus phage 035JT001]|nr:host-nuclease inhibitor protein [Bacillus phage 035JT001]